MYYHWHPHLLPHTLNGHTHTDEAECQCKCLSATIMFLLNGYVLLTGIMSFTSLLMGYIPMYSIEITVFKMTYSCMATARMDIDSFIIQSNTLMAAEKHSETNGYTRHVTSNDDNDYDYRIQPNQHEKLNTTSASQLSIITSWRTYKQRCDPAPKLAKPRTKGKVGWWLRISTILTTSRLVMCININWHVQLPI